jgi:CPA1 family monovalent cation:H+ antiporter
LDNLQDIYDVQLINFLKLDRLRTANIVHLTGIRRAESTSNLQELLRGYYLERKLIFEYENRGDILEDEAMDLRKNVNIMEDFSIRTSNDSNFLLSLFMKSRKNKAKS